jgi:hypothetical protein
MLLDSNIIINESRFLLLLSAMAKTDIISITQSRQFAFPPEILENLEPGDEYLLWQMDDTIVLKKITQTVSLETLFKRIEALDSNSDEPTEAEICEIVKTIRHKRAQTSNAF